MSVVPATRSTCIILYSFLLFFLFDSFLFGTGEIEHPLLQNSGVAISREGVLPGVMLVDHTLDPHIHGGTLHAAIGKQGYAVGHLDASGRVSSAARSSAPAATAWAAARTYGAR